MLMMKLPEAIVAIIKNALAAFSFSHPFTLHGPLPHSPPLILESLLATAHPESACATI